jgi:hypothetical protein
MIQENSERIAFTAQGDVHRRDHIEVRPHGAIGNKMPIELHRMMALPASHSPEEARIPGAGGRRMGRQSQ